MKPSPTEQICKPTKWFMWRAAAMAVMFAVGAGAFFKDYKWGYPEKNVERFYYLAFEKAKKSYLEHLQKGRSPAQWEESAARELVFVPIDKPGERIPKPEEVIPSSQDLKTPWPAVLTDFEKYSAAVENDKGMVTPPGWKKFSNSEDRAWSLKSKDAKSKAKIDEQLYIGLLCLVLLLVALFFLFRTFGRSMKVDSKGYTPPGGKLIPYDAMRKIDARKWETKGLATVFYEEGAKTKKAKIDGMVYGQFKKEDGEPAQRLYKQILSNFKGELIELAAVEADSEKAVEAEDSSH